MADLEPLFKPSDSPINIPAESSNSTQKRCAPLLHSVWSQNIFMLVNLRTNVFPIHYLSYLIFIFTIYSASYYLDITLLFLIKSPDYYNVPENLVAETVGNLIFYRTLVRLVMDPIAGSLHDIISRKNFLIITVAFSAPIFVIIPHCGNIYPNLLIAILLDGILCSILNTTPILRDLVLYNSFGLSMAMLGLAIDLAKIVCVYVYFRLSQEYSLSLGYYCISGILAALAIFLFFAWKSVPVQKPTHQSENIFKMMLNSAFYVKQNPLILLYFVFNFLSFAFIYLSTTYFIIFIASFYGNSEAEIIKSQNAVSSIKGLGNIMNTIFSGGFGFFADKVPDILSKSIACWILCLGALILVFINKCCDSTNIYLGYILLVVGLYCSKIMVFFYYFWG